MHNCLLVFSLLLVALNKSFYLINKYKWNVDAEFKDSVSFIEVVMKITQSLRADQWEHVQKPK